VGGARVAVGLEWGGVGKAGGWKVGGAGEGKGGVNDARG